MDLAELYGAYSERVYRYVRCHLRCDQDAEDLTSTVFERAFSKRHTFDPRRGSIETWLFGIARNALRDHGRRMALRRFSPIAAASHVASPGDAPLEAVLSAERFDALRRALAHLKPRERSVVSLRYFSGLRNVDIAKVMRLSEKNVGVILSRATRKIKAELEREGMA